MSTTKAPSEHPKWDIKHYNNMQLDTNSGKNKYESLAVLLRRFNQMAANAMLGNHKGWHSVALTTLRLPTSE